MTSLATLKCDLEGCEYSVPLCEHLFRAFENQRIQLAEARAECERLARENESLVQGEMGASIDAFDANTDAGKLMQERDAARAEAGAYLADYHRACDVIAEEIGKVDALRAQLAEKTAERNRLRELTKPMSATKYLADAECMRAERDAARAEADRRTREVDVTCDALKKAHAALLSCQADAAVMREALEKIAELNHHQVVSGWQQIARIALDRIKRGGDEG